MPETGSSVGSGSRIPSAGQLHAVRRPAPGSPGAGQECQARHERTGVRVPPAHPPAACTLAGRQPGLSRRHGQQPLARRDSRRGQDSGGRDLEVCLSEHGCLSAGRRPRAADGRSPGARATVRLYALPDLPYTGPHRRTVTDGCRRRGRCSLGRGRQQDCRRPLGHRPALRVHAGTCGRSCVSPRWSSSRRRCR